MAAHVYRHRPILLLLALTLMGVLLAPAGPAQAASGGYIVVLREGVTSSRFAARAGDALSFSTQRVFSQALNGFAARLSPSAAAALRADPRVLFVAAERKVRLAQVTQPSQEASFGVLRIDGELSSTASGDGTGTVDLNVAVLDTGIDYHPDLNLVGGVSCVAESPGFTDVSYHGTMVAGFIGAIDNDIGRVGVAPGARIWSAKVLNGLIVGTDADLLCALEWLVSTRTDADPTNDIAVANMSVTGRGTDDGNCGLTNGDPIHLAACNAVRAGVTLVAAAGNDGQDLQKYFPASYQEVLTATAIADKDGVPGGLGGHLDCLKQAVDDTQAFFTNYATLDEDRAHVIAAPGACISSTYPGGLYAAGSGTSFSSPLVAGTVALCIASGPCSGLTPQQIVQKIVADAAAYNQANPTYGFLGDPLRPDPKQKRRYIGFLIRPGLY